MKKAAKQKGTAELISAIIPLPSDPNMRRIRVGKKTVATLRASDIDSLGVEVGASWTSELEIAVQRDAATLKARKAAMALLSRRAYSRAELIEKLIGRKHESDIVKRVADELAAHHWIDDEALGRTLAQEISERKPVAKRLLAAKLESRKLDSQLADEIATDTLADVDATMSALELARRRLRSMRGQTPQATRRRLAGALSRRGFDEEVIHAVLQRLHFQDTDANEG